MRKIFGKKNDVKDLSKERIKKLTPLAKQIIVLIGNADLGIGDTHARDNDKYNAKAEEIIQLMLDNEVKYVDKDFLFQLIFQPFDLLRETVLTSLKRSFDLVIDKSLHKEFREITLVDMDKVIKGEDIHK